MAIDESTRATLHAARDDAGRAENSDDLERLRDNGESARLALESIPRSDMEAGVRHKIEEAIRHARNTEHASTPAGGQHDAAEVGRIIDEILKAAD